ncbi:MAG: hypothetical protein EBT57_08545 [Verrucomicrobia bacterium]|nr:hypothetical protein [Verrucomicrobiota bacterium]
MRQILCSLAGMWLAMAGARAEETNAGVRITAVRNQVEKSTGATNHPADVGHVVQSGEAVTTGSQGLVEMKGQGDTTVRVGEKSKVSYDEKQRTVQVDQGTVLIHADPKEGPMKVQSGGMTLQVDGDQIRVLEKPKGEDSKKDK